MFGDMGKMLQLVGRIKTELPAVKEKLASSQFTSEAGGGAVAVTVNGKGRVAEIRISPEAMADGDAAMLADIIKAAVAAAQEQASVAAAEAMKELTGGMEIPGLEGLL